MFPLNTPPWLLNTPPSSLKTRVSELNTEVELSDFDWDGVDEDYKYMLKNYNSVKAIRKTDKRVYIEL